MSKPLCRGTIVNVGTAKTMILFRYEKHFNFCYICGLLDHIDKDCSSIFNSLNPDSKGKRQFKPWLCAERRCGVSMEEIEASIGVCNPVVEVVTEQLPGKMVDNVAL